MAIHYNFSAEGDLLVVTAAGFDESLEEVQQYGLAIIQEAVQGNYRAVLCDETQLEYQLGTADTFKSAEFMAGQAPGIGKAAIVFNDRFIQDARFWETVAVNRGLTVRFFKDTAEARAWLAGK